MIKKDEGKDQKSEQRRNRSKYKMIEIGEESQGELELRINA